MLTTKMQQALNEQVNAEIYSAYLYHAMSAYFAAQDLPGFASWMRVQAQEELIHATLIFDYINTRGGRVVLAVVAAPPSDWGSAQAAFESAAVHERKVTGLINALVDVALADKDHATTNFLQWFVSEQVEEEANVDAVVQKLKLAGRDGSGLFMVDRELATRVFTPPAIWTQKG